jgi:hypothetical protein
MPWSDNNMYFDAGQGSGYDRIFKAMSATEIDNNWNHWAFVKKQATGEMFIYKNGVLWHSGTNKNLPVGYIHRFVLGANKDYGNKWKGKVDEFQVYDVALNASTIQSWFTKQPDATHPNWSDLLVYYDFDEVAYAEDKSSNDFLLMPSQQGMIQFDELPLAGIEEVAIRPIISLGQGTVSGAMQTTLEEEKRLKEPTVVFEYQPVDRHFEISNAYVGVLSGNEITYGAAGNVLSQVPFSGSTNLTNQSITYYQQPYELVHDVEIARYITPYGIEFEVYSKLGRRATSKKGYQEHLDKLIKFQNEYIDIEQRHYLKEWHSDLIEMKQIFESNPEYTKFNHHQFPYIPTSVEDLITGKVKSPFVVQQVLIPLASI